MNPGVFASSAIWRVVITSFFFAVTVPYSLAAEISVINTKHCYALLSGRIEEGDSKRIAEVFSHEVLWEFDNTTGRTPKRALCLDSSEGSYLEAVRIVKVLIGSYDADGSAPAQIGTVVDKGMKCLYACAIAFLGGAHHLIETVFQEDRTLHQDGMLGFGLPGHDEPSADVVSPEQLTIAYDQGVEAISELLSLKLELATSTFLPYSFIAQVLSLEPGKLMIIVPGNKLAVLTVKYLSADGGCKLYSLSTVHEGDDCGQVRSY